MKEQQWRTSNDPAKLLARLQGQLSSRKLRLFAVACCRRIWELLVDARSRKAVELAERSADEEVSYRELDHVSAEAEEAWEDVITEEDFSEATHGIGANAAYAASYASGPDLTEDVALESTQAAAEASTNGSQLELTAQATLFRDIFGNPIRHVSFDQDWRTSAAVALARSMYEARDFADMPILADALEEAGCTDDAILGHCRDPKQVHVRGCWVVDLVLGKS